MVIKIIYIHANNTIGIYRTSILFYKIIIYYYRRNMKFIILLTVS
jgi:hypothetical protein